MTLSRSHCYFCVSVDKYVFSPATAPKTQNNKSRIIFKISRRSKSSTEAERFLYSVFLTFLSYILIITERREHGAEERQRE